MVNNFKFPKDRIAVHVLSEQTYFKEVKLGQESCGTEILDENLLEQDPVEHLLMLLVSWMREMSRASLLGGSTSNQLDYTFEK